MNGTHPNMTTVEIDPKFRLCSTEKMSTKCIHPEAVKKLTPNWHGDDEDLQEEELPSSSYQIGSITKKNLFKNLKSMLKLPMMNTTQNKYQATDCY